MEAHRVQDWHGIVFSCEALRHGQNEMALLLILFGVRHFVSKDYVAASLHHALPTSAVSPVVGEDYTWI